MQRIVKIKRKPPEMCYLMTELCIDIEYYINMSYTIFMSYTRLGKRKKQRKKSRSGSTNRKCTRISKEIFILKP